MKYVILRCEDGGPPAGRTAGLLEGAKTSHLHQLAQAGAAGLIRPQARAGRGDALDRFHLHRTLFGLERSDAGAAAGRCYADAAGVTLEPGETAWGCELVTQRDGRIVDPTAGNIPTQESGPLLQALDDELSSETRRWEPGAGPHHVFVTRDPALAAGAKRAVASPECLVGRAWKRHLPSGESGDALRALIERSSAVLDAHPVNRVRVDLGENPANMVWLWGAGAAEPPRPFAERTGLSGSVISNSFLLRGFARSLGLGWREGPASFEEPPLQRLWESLGPALEQQDWLYVHVKVTSGDPVQRLCAMERLDQLLLKPLTERLPRLGPWRLLAAVDDRTLRAVPFIAIGTGLPRQPAASLAADAFAQSPLAFQDGDGAFAWFTQGPTR
jgi:2,3-bisphosphoglycerate-independent phosphoglycerate mutase